MFLGGTLISDKIFKKILSIGYEFETHDLAKLSLHSNKKSLINSDLILRSLKNKIDRNSVKVIDDNYLSVRIPIEKEGKDDQGESNEGESNEEMDEDEREFMEAFNYEIQLEKHENDSYLEYFNENRKHDNKETIKFQITNDITDGEFDYMIKEYCRDLTIPKNEMYIFKTKGGKVFDFKFSDKLTNNCKTFTGVEYVITYYNPKKDNSNVIIDTFVDACSRIIDHLGDLKKTTGALMIADNEKKNYEAIGNIGDERYIFHKPKTNLFYMHTYDNINTATPQILYDVDFIPQMTFRCKAIDLLDIIKEMLKSDKNIKKGRQVIESNKIKLNNINIIEGAINDLFTIYNKTAENKISIDTYEYRNIKSYLFLIYYKLYYYIQNNSVISHKKDNEDDEDDDDDDDDDDDEEDDKEEEKYLKDFIDFSSRHSNYELYIKFKELFGKYYGIKDVEIIHKFLCNYDALNIFYENYFENRGISDSDIDENGQIRDPVNTELKKTNKKYGNPMYSFSSYFKHFEKPPGDHNNDWLIESEIDVYSTTFDLTGDDIMIENRSFRYLIGLYLKNLVDKKVSDEAINLREMHRIVNALYGENLKKMTNLELNPIKNKLTKKCKRGFFRNMDFECTKMKSATKKKSKKLSLKTLREFKQTKNKSKKNSKSIHI